MRTNLADFAQNLMSTKKNSCFWGLYKIEAENYYCNKLNFVWKRKTQQKNKITRHKSSPKQYSGAKCTRWGVLHTFLTNCFTFRLTFNNKQQTVLVVVCLFKIVTVKITNKQTNKNTMNKKTHRLNCKSRNIKASNLQISSLISYNEQQSNGSFVCLLFELLRV